MSGYYMAVGRDGYNHGNFETADEIEDYIDHHHCMFGEWLDREWVSV